MISTIKSKAANIQKANFERLKRAETAMLLPSTAQLDEPWSFVADKSHQRWLWVAICQYSGEILVFTFGDRSDQTCKQLPKLLAPFNVTCHATDN